MESVLDTLVERGFVKDVTNPDGLRQALERPATLYCGYDATADSLTIGHLVSIMMLAWFQRFGHRPIALMGGGTTLVGDPSGRQSARPILSVEQIEHNLQGIRGQFSQFLDFCDGRALMINNADWLAHLNYVEFMREIGSRVSVNEVLRLDAYRTRLEAGGLTFLEFSYVLMQPYDFLRLYQDYDCVLQVGGSDQWGNCVMGADLIRRVTGNEAFVLVSPLILTSAGSKMGKSEAGAIWLNSPPYEYYQYWRNTPDADVEKFLATFTFLPMTEVRRLAALVGSDLNQAKDVLAFEATRLVHGEEPARQAQQAARALFDGGGEHENVPTTEVDCAQLAAGISVAELFKQAGLVSSSNEARSLIRQRGLSIDGESVADPRAVITSESMHDGQLMLSRGRKRHMRVVCRQDS